jgi:UDP-N-acetylmuramoyl-L-alanyl-D-glutamate--2,6-diaminopimelate ligase
MFEKPPAKSLSEILRALTAVSIGSNIELINQAAPEVVLPDCATVTGLTYDSRLVEPGYAFFAISGQKEDGNHYIDNVIARGASCIFTSTAPTRALSVPVVLVKDVLTAQAHVANILFDNPSAKLRVIGITGTNGKTTTTHLIEHIFNSAGRPTGLIGTLGARVPSSSERGKSNYLDVKHTTPQASDLQALFYAMQKQGVGTVAMEVSSHALCLGRVLGTQFSQAALTNISQDHLDFHKTMQHYAQSKQELFKMLNESGKENTTAVINLDDEWAAPFIKEVAPHVKLLTYGFSEEASIRPRNARFSFAGMELDFITPYGDVSFTTKLSGRFNLYNIMTAMAVSLAEGLKLTEIVGALSEFSGVSGRFEVVQTKAKTDAQLPLCIVDYAHTPDGLENVLNAARQLVPEDGKLIALFGCGGDRDSSKRPQMGRIAEKLADLCVVTSDNPRTEEPDQIIADILAGISRLKGVMVESDRAKAIKLAVEQARPSDVLVVAGKGHETYQILKNTTIDFDDRKEVAKALEDKIRL